MSKADYLALSAHRTRALLKNMETLENLTDDQLDEITAVAMNDASTVHHRQCDRMRNTIYAPPFIHDKYKDYARDPSVYDYEAMKARRDRKKKAHK